ncbi:MAG TPA: hypothetical protein VM681_03115, partial [Candidatus Thermoplasmatota archaeon]|nr:hypothetical protein [Candidatus Thermoplasmatota archaeon]
ALSVLASSSVGELVRAADDAERRALPQASQVRAHANESQEILSAGYAALAAEHAWNGIAYAETVRLRASEGALAPRAMLERARAVAEATHDRLDALHARLLALESRLTGLAALEYVLYASHYGMHANYAVVAWAREGYLSDAPTDARAREALRLAHLAFGRATFADGVLNLTEAVESSAVVRVAPGALLAAAVRPPGWDTSGNWTRQSLALGNGSGALSLSHTLDLHQQYIRELVESRYESSGETLAGYARRLAANLTDDHVDAARGLGAAGLVALEAYNHMRFALEFLQGAPPSTLSQSAGDLFSRWGRYVVARDLNDIFSTMETRTAPPEPPNLLPLVVVAAALGAVAVVAAWRRRAA